MNCVDIRFALPVERVFIFFQLLGSIPRDARQLPILAFSFVLQSFWMMFCGIDVCALRVFAKYPIYAV